MMLEDGDILSLSSNRPEVIDSAPVGRLALDGNRLVPMSGGVLSARRRMLFNGVVLASVAVDSTGALRGRPVLSAPGLFEADDPETERVTREFSARLRRPAGPPWSGMTRPCRMRRARRCGGRWDGGCRSGPWWMCIC